MGHLTVFLFAWSPATSEKLINITKRNEHVNEIMVLADLGRRINAALAQINKEPVIAEKVLL